MFTKISLINLLAIWDVLSIGISLIEKWFILIHPYFCCASNVPKSIDRQHKIDNVGKQ